MLDDWMQAGMMVEIIAYIQEYSNVDLKKSNKRIQREDTGYSACRIQGIQELVFMGDNSSVLLIWAWSKVGGSTQVNQFLDQAESGRLSISMEMIETKSNQTAGVNNALS